MPNSRDPSGNQTPNSGRRPGQSQDSGLPWQGNQNQEQDENVNQDGDGTAEVGDPAPENDRTLRASRDKEGLSNGQGETGEDEGLSGDAGDADRH